MLANKMNKNNKRYDDMYPFLLKVVITKADKRGKILSLMAQGKRVGYKTLKEAKEAQDEFHDLAQHTEGSFASYGMTAIIEESTGEIHSPKHLG